MTCLSVLNVGLNPVDRVIYSDSNSRSTSSRNINDTTNSSLVPTSYFSDNALISISFVACCIYTDQELFSPQRMVGD